MAISFNGAPLLLHDPQGTVAAHIAAYLSENQTNWFAARSPAEASLKRASIQRHPARVPLPVFNWPAAPQPRINTLYVPSTGATRWSVGLFLIDSDTWNNVQAGLAGDSSGTLTISDDRTGGSAATAAKSATMYALTPHLVSPDEDHGLLILPLVDARYFWQFMDVGAIALTTSSAWTDVVSAINTATGQTVNVPTTVETNFFKPDRLEFNRPYQNAAQLCDALAASVGRRLVYDLWTNAYSLQGPSDADTLYKAQDQNKFDPASGNYNSQDADGNPITEGELPAQVVCLFPEHVGKLPSGDGTLYKKIITASAASAFADPDEPSTAEWAVFSTAAADLTGLSSGSTPNNHTDLDNLALQIATNFYAWLQRSYDLTAIGHWPFKANGYEDYHLLDLRGTIQTRVATLPVNVGPMTNWAQIGVNSSGDDTNPRQNEFWPGPRLRVELKGDLTPGGSAACYIREWNGSTLIPPQSGASDDTTKTITCYDVRSRYRAIGRDSMNSGGGSGNGAYAEVEYKPDAQRWEFVDCQQVSQKIKVSISTGCVSANAVLTTTAVAVMDPGGQDASHGTGVLSSSGPSNWASHTTVTNYATAIGNSGTSTAGIICAWDESLSPPGYLVVDALCAVGC